MLIVFLVIAAFGSAGLAKKAEERVQKRLSAIRDQGRTPSNEDVIDLSGVGAFAASADVAALVFSVAAVGALLHWVGWL